MNLHGKIMNLQCPAGIELMDAQRSLDYRAGFRDARHAAAELANEHDAIKAVMLEALQAFVKAASLSRLTDGNRSVECELAEQIVAAEDAIAKATGSAM